MKQGFTLLELSIVLVIIGLIIGGIAVGADMIRSAELNSVVSEKNKIVTSINTFKLKYNALPGDMKNATAYWGVAHATPATCKTTASTGAETCDGDGDGKIEHNIAGSVENFRFWQHLANAELLSGQFNGITDGTNNYSATLSNSPEAPITNAIWFINYYGTMSGVANLFNGNYGNYLQIGSPYTNAPPQNPFLTPAEAFSIDQKIDDGKPGTGGISSQYVVNCTDGINFSSLDADYALSTETPECALIWRKVF